MRVNGPLQWVVRALWSLCRVFALAVLTCSGQVLNGTGRQTEAMPGWRKWASAELGGSVSGEEGRLEEAGKC